MKLLNLILLLINPIYNLGTPPKARDEVRYSVGQIVDYLDQDPEKVQQSMKSVNDLYIGAGFTLCAPFYSFSRNHTLTSGIIKNPLYNPNLKVIVNTESVYMINKNAQGSCIVYIPGINGLYGDDDIFGLYNSFSPFAQLAIETNSHFLAIDPYGYRMSNVSALVRKLDIAPLLQIINFGIYSSQHHSAPFNHCQTVLVDFLHKLVQEGHGDCEFELNLVGASFGGSICQLFMRTDTYQNSIKSVCLFAPLLLDVAFDKVAPGNNMSVCIFFGGKEDVLSNPVLAGAVLLRGGYRGLYFPSYTKSGMAEYTKCTKLHIPTTLILLSDMNHSDLVMLFRVKNIVLYALKLNILSRRIVKGYHDLQNA